MMFNLYPFVYLNQIRFENRDEIVYFFSELEKYNTEQKGFYGFSLFEDYLVINFFKITNSFDVSYDSNNKRILSHPVSHSTTAEIRLNIFDGTLIIWGRPSIIADINNELKPCTYISFLNKQLKFKEFYKNFKKYEHKISEISFNDIKVLNKYISKATLKTTDGKDALYLINNLGATVSNIKIELFPKTEDLIELDINLSKRIIELNFSSISSVSLENLKELINNLSIV